MQMSDFAFESSCLKCCKLNDVKAENHVTYIGYFVSVFGQDGYENCSLILNEFSCSKNQIP